VIFLEEIYFGFENFGVGTRLYFALGGIATRRRRKMRRRRI
jgi:hypothetical protein